VTDQVEVVIADELLRTLHDHAIVLSTSPSPLVANWGRHLLEDWRSLELLAEKQRSVQSTPVLSSREQRENNAIPAWRIR
jgi:hypothetical protein